MSAVSAFWKFHLQNAGRSVAIATLPFAVLQNVLQKYGQKSSLSLSAQLRTLLGEISPFANLFSAQAGLRAVRSCFQAHRCQWNSFPWL